MRITNYESLTEIQKKLVDEAEKVMENSYNPYSKFFVGAALLTKNGEIITSTNVENAAYGDSICAERSAVVRANAEGHRMFKSIAIITKGEEFDTIDPSAPCGSCRGVLYEFSQIAEKNLEIIMSSTKKDKIKITSINELMPSGFGPKDLGIDVKKYQK